MSDFFNGILYFIAGFGLITKPGVKRFVIIPILINVLLFTLLFMVTRHFMAEFNAWFLHFLPTWLHWLSYILWLLFITSFFVVLVLTFVIVANLISAPFNSLLAERVERYLIPQASTAHIAAALRPSRQAASQLSSGRANISVRPEEARSAVSKDGSLTNAFHIIGRQLAILLYYLPRMLFMLVLFFIPLVQIIAPIMWLLFNAWFMTLTYYDYPSDNHQQGFVQMLQALRQKRLLALGFGLSVLAASMVPVLNLVVIPVAVAGATKLWLAVPNKHGE